MIKKVEDNNIKCILNGKGGVGEVVVGKVVVGKGSHCIGNR